MVLNYLLSYFLHLSQLRLCFLWSEEIVVYGKLSYVAGTTAIWVSGDIIRVKRL